MTEVSALYVDPKGVYPQLGLDCWDEQRDARNYVGPNPVVAHPPCAAWCKVAALREHRYGLKRGEDSGCFAAALAQVLVFGGVLEHPAESAAWSAYGLQIPKFGSWQQAAAGYWVTEVWQVAYGHRARKRTWLLYSGRNTPTAMLWLRLPHSACISGMTNRSKRPTANGNRLWGKAASSTPEAFAHALITLARGAV